MNRQLGKEEVNIWHVLVNQVRKATECTKSAQQGRKRKLRANPDYNTLSALALCWAFFYGVYFLFFGFNQYYVDTILLTMYYTTQSLGGLLSIALMFFSCCLVQRRVTFTQRVATVLFFSLTLLDVSMSFDACFNIAEWDALNSFYDFMHGNPERILSFGAREVAFLVLGVMCMNLSYSRYGRA